MNEMRITSVQDVLHWEDEQSNVQMFTDLLSHLKGKTDLIVLPEMFNSGFSMRPEQFAQTIDGSTVRWMQQLAQQLDCAICGSLAIQESSSLATQEISSLAIQESSSLAAQESSSLAIQESSSLAIQEGGSLATQEISSLAIQESGSLAIQEGGGFVNKFIFVHPSGAIDQYNKRHCFRMSGEHEVYTPGVEKLIVDYRGWKILAQVCYDLRFPVFSRNENDYDLALYVANWPQVRRAPWLILLQARAIENLAYVIGVNRIGEDDNGVIYSGDSIVVDYRGDVIFDHKDTASIHTQVLNLQALNDFRQKFPAWMDADAFSLQV